MISISEELSPPFKVVLKTGILDKLVSIVKNYKEAKNKIQLDLLYMTLWVVSNLLWENSTMKYVIDNKIHLVLIELLEFR